MELSALESIGMTRGEVKVYLSLLEIGETTTGPIIERSGVTGSKVYEVLNRLIEKGLASYVVRDGTRHFQPASPRNLLGYLDRRESQMLEQKQEVERVIPRLEALQRAKQPAQSAQVFEGYEGIKTVFNLVLEVVLPREGYCAFSLGEEFNRRFASFLFNHHRRRARRKVGVRLIANSGERGIFKNLTRLRGFQVRYHDNAAAIGVLVFKDYVATFSFRTAPVAFLIRSQQVADSYRKFFENLWATAQE
jgi:sugar-specific transcriptional regulator TrmB